MKTFNLKSITLVLFLLSASLQVWANKTYNNGDVLYYDFTAVSGGVNWSDQDGDLRYDASGGGKIITCNFTKSKTFTNGTCYAKTATGGWTCWNWTDPGTGKNCIKVSSDGKTFSWTTYTPATPTTTTFYFDNSTTNWSSVYLYLYSQNYYESNGSGSQSSKGCYAECLQMSLVTGSSKIYKYEYTGNEPAYVCFLNASQSNYGNFWNGTAGTVRGAYKQFTDNTKTLYTPTSTYETKNNVYYYNSGSWSAYNSNPSIVFSSTSSTINLGGSVILTANCANVATGSTVTFYKTTSTSSTTESSILGTGTTNSSGVATYTYIPTTRTATTYIGAKVGSAPTRTSTNYTLSMNAPAATLTANTNPVTANANTTLTVGYSNITTTNATIKYKIEDVTSSTTILSKGTTNSATKSWASAGTYTVRATVYVTVTGGSEVSYTKDLSVTVSAPTPTISFSSTSSTINLGESVTLTANCANVATGSTVTFYKTTSSTSTTESATLGTATTNSSGVATFTYTPNAYLATTYIVAKVSTANTATNYTLSMRTPTVSLSASPTSNIGTGDDVTFTATASNVGSGATVTYNFKTISGGTAVQATSSNTYTTSWATAGTKTIYITITVKVGNGTAYTSTQASKSVTVQNKTTIYFDNSITGWSKVYLYLYSSNYYESNGSGSQSAKGCYAECLQMSLVAGSSTIYSYTYLGTVPSYVCFLNASQSNYGNFWDGTAGNVRGAYKSFSASTPLYIPTSTYETKNNVYYYNSGSWSEYPPSSYTLTVNVSPSGAGSITTPSDGTATVTKYSTTTITATKNNGYTFTGWTKTGTATITNANNLSTTVTNVQSDATITANFTQDKYKVTYNINSGTGTVPTDNTQYTYNQTVTVKGQNGISRTGYTFGGWNTNSSGTGTNYTAGSGTFNITKNTTLYAKWIENKHNVTISYKCGSTTIKDNTTQNNVSEAVATSGITAPAIVGYTFSSWTVGSGVTITTGSTSSSTISIKTKASGNYTLTANYTQDNYTVTVNSVGGEISAPSGGSLTNKHYGDVVTIIANNPDALTFVGWTASPAANATIANSSLLSTTATIKGNVTLTATFRMPITVYFSNEQCWDEVKIHAWGAVGGSVSSTFPGNAMTQNSDGWWTYTFDKSITQVNFLFANSSGTYQSNDCSNVTTTTYYKMSSTTAGDRAVETTTSSYEPSRCTPDVYTVVGDEALVGSNWDTGDGANEMIWNSTNNRYELRKVNVSLAAGYKYYRFVKNHCYLGSGCGQWPAEGQSNANYNFTSAKSYDLVFWLKPSSDFSHPGLNDTYGLEVYDAATYFINHPWGDGNGSWTKKEMTYSGSGNTYLASGVFGGNGADIFRGDSKVKYFANNNSEISGYNNVTVGDNVVFTYDASLNTLSVACPTCVHINKYWICVPTTAGSTMPEQPTLMTYNSDDGLYYTDPVTQPFLWPNNGAKVNANNNCSDNWIDRNNIVNYASMTLGQKVQYIYDPDINQLTVVDANTPKITLTATQVVNATATQSVITLRTTSSKTINNATYSYTKVSGPDGTLAASTTNSTTFTTSNEGTYNFKVTVSCDEGTFTATCTVKVKFKITIFANVAAPNWSGTINLYYWATGVTGANHAMTSVGGKWYKYVVTGVPEFSFIVRQGTSSGSYQTIDIGPIDDDICIVVSSNIQSGGSSRLYSVTTDCELYMRFASTYTQMKGSQSTGETKTVYSNLFKQTGDQVSFYVGSTPNVKFQTFNSTNNAWDAGTTVATGVSGGNVYYGEYNSSASNKLKDFALYNDDFYLRSDAGPGGWTDYKKANQAFFEFSHNDYYPNEWYNHYYCRWTGDGTNVKAVVANSINPALTDTLDDFYLTQSTNMRFEYDNETNYIGRQFLKGSTTGFLQIFASDTDAENFIYNHQSSDTRIKKANAVTFTDMSDWVYLVDVYAKPTGSDVNVYVLGRYPVTRTGIGAVSDQDNYLGGYDEDGVTPLPIKIMGSSTTPDTYNMRLIYDYKTNRLMAAWYPEDNDVSGAEVTVDANFMLSRENDEVAKTVGMTTGNGKIVSINQMIAALTITRNAYNTRKSNGNYYYWVSLPYDVYVRDIYGISGYGKKWVVQRYRGDMRAKYGFLDTIETFWANMKQNATAKMEANRGYVIRLQLTDEDFKEINGLSQVTLYFPSCNSADIQLKNSTTALQTSVSEHLCEVVEPNGTPRKNWDSHWNVIGQPGLKTMKITSPTSASGENEDEYIHYPKYYYKWSWSGGQGDYTPTAVSGTDNAFKTMYAYMVQYGGETITWQPNIETIDPSLAPRRVKQNTEEDILISLTATAEREVEHIVGEDQHSEYEQVTDFDRTLLTLSEQGTDNFVLNQDMSKTKSGKLNIYTVFDKTNTAGKVIPMNTKEVPVIVEINYENEVIFALDKEISKKTITFVDYLEGTETILNSADYRISLSAGKYDKRFAIRISERTEIPTDIAENANNGDSEIRLLRDGQQLYFEGLTQNETLRMFDATGKCLMSTTISNGEHFGVPSQGMYLLQVGTQTFKVAIN